MELNFKYNSLDFGIDIKSHLNHINVSNILIIGGAGSWTNASNPATATYTAGASESGSITLTLTTSGSSCTAVTATKNITVNENPTANAGDAMSAIC